MTSPTLSTLRQPFFAAALMALTASPAAAIARDQPSDNRVEVRVHLPAAPAGNDATARRSIARIDKAALVACGGSQDSFAQVKAALRQSACWHQAMASAVDQAADPQLRAWWAAHPS